MNLSDLVTLLTPAVLNKEDRQAMRPYLSMVPGPVGMGAEVMGNIDEHGLGKGLMASAATLGSPAIVRGMLGKAAGGLMGGAARNIFAGEKEKTVKFWDDNPGGSWLENERKLAAKSSIPTSGSPTYGTESAVNLPPSMLKYFPGRNNEHLPGPNLRGSGEKAAAIRKSFEQGSTGIEKPIFVQVASDGRAFINEGNNRLAVALEKGLPTIPVKVQYHAGGELVDGPLSPAKIEEAVNELLKLNGMGLMSK